MKMSSFCRHLAAAWLVLATFSAHAMPDQASKPAPLKLVLTRECGTEKNEALGMFSKRPLAWCSFNNTKLTAGTEDAAALAGRRLYAQIDFQPKSASKIPISMTLSAFSASGEVTSHVGTFFDVGEGMLEASVYVPEGSKSVYWIVSGGSYQEENASLVIRNAQAFVSEARFQPGEMCAPCRQYLDETIERVRREFLFADRLHMEELAGALRRAASGAQDVREMDSVLKELSRKVNEATIAAGMLPHGLYYTQAEYEANVSRTPFAQAQEASASAPLFDTQRHGERLGYIRLRAFLQSDSEHGSAYARALRDAVASLHRQGADQWILDLRDHQGGTLFPAIVALRPLLGSGSVGYFTDSNGKQHTSWLWGAPGAPAAPGVTEDVNPAAPLPTFDGERQAVAILLGPKTDSSGEMLAIAFHGRANTRSFGAPSAGFTTAVNGARDRYGNFFGFIGAYAADRNGQRIFPKVIPDVPVASSVAQQAQSDPVLGAAIQWLDEMRGTDQMTSLHCQGAK